MWQRWNQTSHIFEKSDNDGALWTPLPLNGSIITEGTVPLARMPTYGDLAITGKYFESNRNNALGYWIDVPNDPANFYTTDGGTSIAINTIYSYTVSLVGKTLNVNFYGILTITGTPVRFYIKFPPSFGIVFRHSAGFSFNYYMGNGLPGTGVGMTAPGLPYIDMLRDIAGTPWAAGNCFILFCVPLSLN